MKDPDIIRAVAEFDGKDITKVRRVHHDAYFGGGWRNEPDIPPYLTSLDAIVPVTEKTYKTFEYVYALKQIIQRDGPKESDLGREKQLINATARQRCEALLRTIGKWRETDKTLEHMKEEGWT